MLLKVAISAVYINDSNFLLFSKAINIGKNHSIPGKFIIVGFL